MGLKKILGYQAANPKGILGRFVGRKMGENNLHSNKWVVSQLNIKAKDKILEIGFGPGTAIQELFYIEKDILVSGIDISELMVKQATKLNQAAQSNGKLDLQLGDVSAMPWEDDFFDKAFAINVVYLWSELLNIFKEVRRVLKPNGLMAIYVAPVEMMHKLGFAELENFTLHTKEDVVNACKQSGFPKVEITSTEVDDGTGVCILAWM